jgi:Tfp pilus assembly protein PilF
VSIILDALRRGRVRPTPAGKQHPAQADAVLQTLGYGRRFKSASPVSRFKRSSGLVIGAVLLVLALWGGAIWVRHKYFGPASAPEHRAAARQVAPVSSDAAQAPSTAAPIVPRAPVAPVARGRSAPVASTFAAKDAASTFAPRATADKTADKPNALIAPFTPAEIVQNSRRPAVPQSVPTAPSGAPSRTALSTLAGTSKATVTTGEDHFSLAVYFHRLGDFENSLFHYKQLLQRDELNAEAHNNLGLLYRDKGLLEDALKEFQRAIAIQPRYARAHNNLGVVYLNQRKLDLASSEFHAALSIDPRNVESLVNLSTVEREAGRLDNARAAVLRALAMDSGNAEAHYNFGLIEDEAGNKQRALVHYRAFLQYGAAGYPTLVAEVRKRVDALAR